MKKQLLLASIALMSFGAFAQTAPVMGKLFPVTPKKTLPSLINTERGGAATCSDDTLHYPYVKEAIQTTPNFGGFYLLANSTATGNAYAQKFTNTSAVTITGVNFWGFVLDRVNPSQSLTVNVDVFNVNATNRPTTSLGTTTLTLTGMTDAFYTATFSTPITTSANYAIVVTNPSTTDSLGIILNAAQTAVSGGYGEGLSSLKYSGTWYDPNALFGGTDEPEYVVAPIVSYLIAPNYTVSANPTCIGTTLNFTNTTTPTGHLTNKMYNWNVFAQSYALASSDSTYVWDMNDASAIIWSTNASHAYAAAGSYNSALYVLAGFWKSCSSQMNEIIVVDPNAVASYTADATNAPTVAFTNTSTGGTSYSWDFGDGSPADLTQNPSHTYSANGTYTVVLTVTGPCNTVTSSQTVTISVTGIDTYSQESFSVYPNPSNGLYTVNMNTTAKTTVEVYNVIGEVVFSTQLTNNTALVDLTNYSAGVYSMKVISENTTIVKQIVLTK